MSEVIKLRDGLIVVTPENDPAEEIYYGDGEGETPKAEAVKIYQDRITEIEKQIAEMTGDRAPIDCSKISDPMMKRLAEQHNSAIGYTDAKNELDKKRQILALMEEEE